MVRSAFFLALLLLVPPLGADTLPEKADPVVGYRIDVRLDTASKQLDGREHITWRNPSDEPVPDLWFHLYLNAFRNNRSTFFFESGGQLRGDTYAEGKWGWTEVRSLRLADGTDLAGKMMFEHPDDDNADDRTVMRVVLPHPVAPGETVELDLGFLAQLPQVYARSGYRHDFFLAGQWFPKLGVYEPAGMRGRKAGGWNCHQYHANSEFYADYGDFEVNITLPARFVVGATGRRTKRVENSDGTVTYTYAQSDIHDFAWTASPYFVEVKRMFRAPDEVTPEEYARTAELLGRSLDEVKLSDVEVTFLMQPGHMPQLERHISAAMGAIKYFGLWYGRYPYSTLTVVDPGVGASGAGGMEYPTFITAGTSFLLNYRPFERIRMPELVTIHEFGHQFWYGMVGSNEFEEAWLDEGINSYSTGRVLNRMYGGAVLDVFGWKFTETEMIRMQNSPNALFNRILTPAWAFTPTSVYGFYSYTKPEIVLQTMENILGEKVMARIMRTFQERWRFRHPSTEDFFAVADEVAGRDLSWYLDPTIRGTDIVDYEVGSITNRKPDEPRGMFEQDGKLVERNAGNGDEGPQTDGASSYESSAVLERRGGIRIPVDVELKFEGAPPQIVHWDGKDRTVTYRFHRPERLEEVNIDPNRKILLDVDWLNNGKRVESDGRAAAKLASGWLFWIENLMALVGY